VVTALRALGYEFSKDLFGASTAVDDGGVDLIMAIFLEDVEDVSGFFWIVDSNLFGT
jgi:hypothetical protein